jgi:hypothetical protein
MSMSSPWISPESIQRRTRARMLAERIELGAEPLKSSDGDLANQARFVPEQFVDGRQ